MSIDPENLDITALPSLPLSESSKLPTVAGVYFVVCDKEPFLLYIGSSGCLRNRVYLHDKKTCFETFGSITVSWIVVDKTDALSSYERSLINYYRPHLNDGGPTPLRPGPRPKGRLRYDISLPPELAEWAKDHPEGLSGLIRRLLATERARLYASP